MRLSLGFGLSVCFLFGIAAHRSRAGSLSSQAISAVSRKVFGHPEAGSAAPLGLTVPPDVLESVTEPRCTPVGVTSARDAHGRPGGDSTPSGQDWNWACRMLESGSDPERTYRELVQRAWERRGQDAERYARRTVERALVKVRSRRG